MRTLLVLFLAVAALPLPGSAQRLGKAPKRPRLVAADTNDPRAYFTLGQQQMERNIELAKDAFYWAARLDPGHAEALYGLALGLIGSNRSLAQQWFRGARGGGRSKDMRHVDSLLFQAYTQDPFLNTRLYQAMWMSYVRDLIEMETRGSSEAPGAGEIQFYLARLLQNASPDVRAEIAASEGRTTDALRLYAEAIRGSKRKAGFHVERARLQARTGQADSAIASFQAALTELRAEDAKDLVVLYNSKAALEHGIAMLLEARDDVPGAREAYGRALQEDLAYYPAHTRLALLAAGARDSATAVSELELATQAAPDDPMTRLMYATALLTFNDVSGAIAQLEKAVAIEPLWAAPWATLAQALERKSDGPRALEAYKAYFERAWPGHPLYKDMQARHAELKEIMGIKP